MKTKKPKKTEKRVAEVKRPQQFSMPKLGMKGTGSYSPPPERSTNEDKGDNDGR